MKIDTLYFFLKFYLFSNVKITLNPIVEIILISTVYVICILEIFNKIVKEKNL